MAAETAVQAMTNIRRRIHNTLIHHLAEYPDINAEWQGPLVEGNRRRIFCYVILPMDEPDEVTMPQIASTIHTQIISNHVAHWKLSMIQIYYEPDYTAQGNHTQVFSCTIFDVDHDEDWEPVEPTVHVPSADAAV